MYGRFPDNVLVEERAVPRLENYAKEDERTADRKERPVALHSIFVINE